MADDLYAYVTHPNVRLEAYPGSYVYDPGRKYM